MDLARYYGVPVWLVGSALLDSNGDPRDWDFRVVLSDEEFARRFGPPGPLERRGDGFEETWKWIEQMGSGLWTSVRWKWAAECVKRSKEVSRRIGLNVDFQIHPKTYADAQYQRAPRYRLDRCKVAKGGRKRGISMRSRILSALKAACYCKDVMDRLRRAKKKLPRGTRVWCSYCGARSAGIAAVIEAALREVP